MSTHATFGEMRIAWRRNWISGSVYSCEASETKSMACADGSAASVVNACAEVRPPTPGESMSVRPLCRSLRGRRTSAPVTSRSRSGVARSDT